MAGGGHIIIRSAIRPVASLDIVTANITPRKCGQRDAILAKTEADWSDDEFETLLHLIKCAQIEAQ